MRCAIFKETAALSVCVAAAMSLARLLIARLASGLQPPAWASTTNGKKTQALPPALRVCVLVTPLIIFVLSENQGYLGFPITQLGVAQAGSYCKINCLWLDPVLPGHPDVCRASSLGR